MGKVTGFMEIGRKMAPRRPVEDRLKDWFQVYREPADSLVQSQGARCMDCGIPFCHTGCPLGNIIPDWNDLVYHPCLPPFVPGKRWPWWVRARPVWPVRTS